MALFADLPITERIPIREEFVGRLRELAAQRDAAVKAAAALPAIDAETRGYVAAMAIALGVEFERIDGVDLEDPALVLVPEAGQRLQSSSLNRSR